MGLANYGNVTRAQSTARAKSLAVTFAAFPTMAPGIVLAQAIVTQRGDRALAGPPGR